MKIRERSDQNVTGKGKRTEKLRRMKERPVSRESKGRGHRGPATRGGFLKKAEGDQH